MKPFTVAVLWLGLACRLAAAEAPSLNIGSGAAPPAFDTPLRDQITYADPDLNDTLYPVSVNNWWGYMNKRGRLIVFPTHDWADDFYDGLARAVARGKTGFIRGDGEWVLDPVYPYADRFAEGRAVVGDGEHFGYIDKTGKLIVPVRLDGALRFREGVAGVMRDGLCGFIDPAGGLAVPLRYARVRSYHEGFAAFTRAGPAGGPDVVGYLDRRGKEVFADSSGRVAEPGDFNDGLARIRVGEKWGYLGRNWKMRIDARFDGARDFTHGVAAVHVVAKWGYIDKTGKPVVEPAFDDADDMEDPLAMVTLGGKVGYINRDASQGITPQFTEGRPYFQDYARVYIEPSFGYIDRVGTPIWDPRRALQGFINRRDKESALIKHNEDIIHHRTIDPPQYREPIAEPYLPDYLYEEQLPGTGG